jgi:hypothetical protein
MADIIARPSSSPRQPQRWRRFQKATAYLHALFRFHFHSFSSAFVKAWLWALAVSGALGVLVPLAVHFFKPTTTQEATITALYWQIPGLFFLLLFAIMLFYVPFSKYQKLQTEYTTVADKLETTNTEKGNLAEKNQELSTQRDAIDGARIQSNARVANLEQQMSVIQCQLDEASFQLSNLTWLRLVAEQDQNEIERMIHTWNPTIDGYDFKSPSPWIQFVFWIFNGSIYTVAIEDAVEGFVTYGDRKLQGQVTRDSRWNIGQLYRGWTARVKFQLWLAQEDAEFLNAEFQREDSNPPTTFQFHNLEILVSSDANVVPRPLTFHFGGVSKNQRIQ